MWARYFDDKRMFGSKLGVRTSKIRPQGQHLSTTNGLKASVSYKKNSTYGKEAPYSGFLFHGRGFLPPWRVFYLYKRFSYYFKWSFLFIVRVFFFSFTSFSRHLFSGQHPLTTSIHISLTKLV